MAATYLSPGVYVEEVSSGSRPIEAVGTAVAAFVGFAEKGPVHEPTLITNWTQFTRTFGTFLDGAYLPLAVYGFFLNGGGSAYVVRIGAGMVGNAANSGDEPAALTAGHATASLPASTGDKTALRVRALQPGPAGRALAVLVEAASTPSDGTFTLTVKQGDKVVETFADVTVKRGATNVVTAVRQRSKLIAVEETKGGSLVPRQGAEVALSGGDAAPADNRLDAAEYVGDVGDRTGFAGLEALEDVTMLCAPDLMSAYQRGALDDDGLKAVQLGMIAHCELMGDRVAILDPPPGLNAQQLKEWRNVVAGYDSKYAALYWPWIRVMDPAQGKPILMPPSGHLAGVWARSDETRGVHKAPANEVVRGALTLELAITKGEHDQLNPIGVNCIRFFPGQGIRVWGARTLSSDAEWRYLNVRRLFNWVEKSILLGTNWVVFEPNDAALWDTVGRVITMFLGRIWATGALMGSSWAEGFYVKCDAENNPPENLDAGVLTVDIGLAPVKPAEFVVFRLSQLAQGAALEE
ncbi:tail protein [Actinocatenispora thailandica]|uniref:Tail protein n=1 Tax=Actinocatenispora thailandica TaxID=227318 RepID=A0A7R7HZ35_9ACTN|nr:phage tail sheath subtilisin-like domain-containing protein [Actinocatenispora thailandica]BCJ37206.1 tail protein [Actinocatenispora thailandica]